MSKEVETIQEWLDTDKVVHVANLVVKNTDESHNTNLEIIGEARSAYGHGNVILSFAMALGSREKVYAREEPGYMGIYVTAEAFRAEQQALGQ